MIDKQIELLKRAKESGLTATDITVHRVPAPLALEWVAAGLIDSLEPGPEGNPITGHLRDENGHSHATVFTTVRS